MSAFFCDPLVRKWLAQVKAGNCYASLHFEVPSADDPGASEVSGGTYARSTLTWDDAGASTRAVWNVQDLAWLNLQQVTVVAVGAWDAPAKGSCLLWTVLDEPVAVPDRGSYALPAHGLFIAF